jgi:hypothetical protein
MNCSEEGGIMLIGTGEQGIGTHLTAVGSSVHLSLLTQTVNCNKIFNSRLITFLTKNPYCEMQQYFTVVITQLELSVSLVHVRNMCTVGQNMCTVGKNMCTVGQNMCTVGQNTCTVRQNTCTVGQNMCTVGQNTCTVGQNICTVGQNMCTVEQNILKRTSGGNFH